MHRSKIRNTLVRFADGDGPGSDGGGSTNQDPAPRKGGEWTPPASQEELDKIINRAVGRAHDRYKDYDQLKEKAARADALDNELASETDKAVRTARDEEKKSARDTYSPRLVRAEFRAAAKGVLTSEQLDSLLEDADLSRFVGQDGEVDVDKVTKKVTAFAPAGDRQSFPDLGGGSRGSTSPAYDMNALIRSAAGRG